jgi:hypothetical protein
LLLAHHSRSFGLAASIGPVIIIPILGGSSTKKFLRTFLA